MNNQSVLIFVSPYKIYDKVMGWSISTQNNFHIFNDKHSITYKIQERIINFGCVFANNGICMLMRIDCLFEFVTVFTTGREWKVEKESTALFIVVPYIASNLYTQPPQLLMWYVIPCDKHHSS